MGSGKKIKTDRTAEIKREAILPLQFLSRDDYVAAIALSTLTLGVYALTAAPGVTLADSADYISGVLTLGVVHPPGYPLYTMTGHLFSLLPIGDPAFRVNLFSALWGALCLGMLFLNLRILSLPPLHAAFGSLFLGFTTVFWSETGVAEVYTFNGFLLASVVFWILSYNRDKKPYQLYLTALSTGLALSNHYPLVILSGIGLVFLLDRHDLRPRIFLKSVVFFLLGLTPYLYLFVQASRSELDYNFGKISDFGMVLDHILRKYYVNEAGGQLWDKFILSLAFVKSILSNFLIATIFIIAGLVCSFKEKWRYRYPILLAALGPSLGLIFILTFPNDEHHFGLMAAYSIPSFLFLVPFLVFGLKTLMNRYEIRKWLQVTILIGSLVFQIGLNFARASHHNNRLADVWGKELLNSLPSNAELILCGQGTFPLHYLQLIENVRPDINIYDRNSFWTTKNLYGPRLFFKRTRMDGEAFRKQREGEINRTSDIPVFYTCKAPIDDLAASFSFTPFLFRADKRHAEASSDYANYRVSDALLDTLANGYPKTDHWTHIHKEAIFLRLLSFFGGNRRPEVDRVLDTLKSTDLYSDPAFLLRVASNIYYYSNHSLAEKLYHRAEELSLKDFSPTDLAVYCNILANAKDFDKALGICLRQEKVSASCDGNTVNTQQTIAAIYKEKGNWSKMARYSRRILECQPDHKVAQDYLEMATQANK